MSPNKNRTRGVRRRDRAENVKNAQSGIPLFQVSTWMLGRSMTAVCCQCFIASTENISSTEPGYLAETTQTTTSALVTEKAYSILK